MKITETDALTNETVERVATVEELAQYELDQASRETVEAEKAAKVAAKAAALAKLGLTESEAAALL